jgi:pyridoxal phosphate enzyme (YggS family)
MRQKLLGVGEAAREILEMIPSNVLLVAAAKTRTLEEIQAGIDAGIKHIGFNYVQEAVPIIEVIGNLVKWHMIGHLQRNKAKAAVHYFDRIETVDSWRLANAIDRRCAAIGKIMPVLIEINSGREKSKTGLWPEEVDDLISKMTTLKHVRVEGLMTMGPHFGDPEKSRPYFKVTREIFEHIAKKNLPNINMHYLSMGMSNSFRIAIEEGANIIRIGTRIFGERKEKE